MRISDWSSDVCSSDLALRVPRLPRPSVSRLLPTLITALRQAGSGCSGNGCGRSADTQAPSWMRKVVCAAHHPGYRARESARMRTGGDPEYANDLGGSQAQLGARADSIARLIVWSVPAAASGKIGRAHV